LLGTFLLKQPPPTAETLRSAPYACPWETAAKEFLENSALPHPVIIAYVMLTILRDFSEDLPMNMGRDGLSAPGGCICPAQHIVSLIVLAVVGGSF